MLVYKKYTAILFFGDMCVALICMPSDVIRRMGTTGKYAAIPLTGWRCRHCRRATLYETKRYIHTERADTSLHAQLAK